MKLLVFEWKAGTYTFPDIEESFNRNGISYRVVSYSFSDMNEDAFFEYRFDQFFKEDTYDAVFSVNYFPLVAKCCEKEHIPYVSWCYDNPLDVPDIEKTLGFECNHVFVFDRIQAAKYANMGFANVYHMPLAANVRRLDQIVLSKKDRELYSTQISFVGKLYESEYKNYYDLMDDYCKGYLDSIMKAQSLIYGTYFVDEVLSDDLMKHINEHFKVLDPNTSFELPKEALSYAVGAELTRKERLLLLSLLSSRYEVKLYSREQSPVLSKCKFMGSCGYHTQMPMIFKASDVNLNINLRISQSGVPLRVMDILGAGGFLISSFQPEVYEYFDGGCVLYESIEDAYEKVAYYLSHGDERARIAQIGHGIVAENYTYDIQLKRIFEMSGLI